MSLRTLKYHEKKLLKKVDFLQWKTDAGLRENKILRKYYIQRREDYVKYNKIVGMITKLTHRLKKLDPADPYRIRLTTQLLEKIFAMGLIPTKKSLTECDGLSASALCRRRLAVMLVRLRMSETLRNAVTLIEQGHIRVGPQVVTDPAFLVTRTMEDFVTWVDSSKIRAKIDKYNDKVDDFALLGN